MITNLTAAQTGEQRRTVVVNGQSGEIIVYQIDGRSFVDLESLARVANGSLSFQQNQIVLTIPATQQTTPTAATANSQPPEAGLTDAFMKSAVQTLAVTRDWTNTLAWAAQNGVPGNASRLFTFHDRASEALHLTQVAASTPSDKNALQLLTNQVNAVQTWNNTLVAQRQSMNTGQYSMTPNSMQNDPAYQKILLDISEHDVAERSVSGQRFLPLNLIQVRRVRFISIEPAVMLRARSLIRSHTSLVLCSCSCDLLTRHPRCHARLGRL